MRKQLGVLAFALILFVGLPSKGQAFVPLVMAAFGSALLPYVGQVGGTWLTSMAIENAIKGVLVAVGSYPVATVLLAAIVIESGLLIHKLTKSSPKESPQIIYPPYPYNPSPYPYYPGIGNNAGLGGARAPYLPYPIPGSGVKGTDPFNLIPSKDKEVPKPNYHLLPNDEQNGPKLLEHKRD